MAVVGLLAVGGWSYWPTLSAMGHRWVHDPQYSHGYLVPAFALVLLYLRRDRLAGVTPKANAWGLALIAAGALLRWYGTKIYFEWLETVSLLPILAGLVVLFGGWSALRWAWPGIAFLLFMIPLPFKVENALAFPLQRTATVCSNYVLQTIGLPALAEGNVIHLTSGDINVIEACSGLSMLLIFCAMATAVVLVVQRPWLDKAVILLSAVPIAIIANVTRITVTGLAQEYVGPDLAHRFFHDWAGLLMMPLALALLWFELWVMAHLLLEPQAAPLTLALNNPVLPRRNRRG
jgi:exosortase